MQTLTYDILMPFVVFVQSILCIFFMSRRMTINSSYGTALTGSAMLGFSSISLIPQINSYNGYIIFLTTVFVLLCIDQLIVNHNKKKKLALWSNCIGLSTFGLLSSVSLSMLENVNTLKVMIVLSIYTICT